MRGLRRMAVAMSVATFGQPVESILPGSWWFQFQLTPTCS